MPPPADDRDPALAALRASLNGYAPISDATWERFRSFCVVSRVGRGTHFARPGEVPVAFGFVHRGLLRGYLLDADGHEYNKVFFPEGTYPGSIRALLTGEPTSFGVEALEDTVLVRIDFARFRALLRASPDLMWFQIRYLETNWLLAKEPREAALVQETATERYLRFRREHPDLENRVPQYHIASHLGVTPTQLSRIRRQLLDREFPPGA